MTYAMTLEQLRIFVAVAEREHVTQAARDLNLAQSAASHAIAALEARHDTRLFDRVGRRIELTEAGRAFLVEARTVLAQAERAEQTLVEFGRLERGTLTVQASQTIAGYWLPRHIVAFRGAWPHIELRLAIGNTAEAVAAIEAGTAELGFVEGEVESDLLDTLQVARDQLIVVVGLSHPWVDHPPATAEELTETDWVLREPGSGTRSAFQQALAAQGVAPERLRVGLELPSNEAVRAAVEAGFGATAISASVAAPALENGLLHHVPFRLPDRAFHLLRHRQRHRSKIAQAFVALLVA
ncbi:MAG TPA: LysR family transcriptional regulator [Rhodopila sp.]|uniref:LysR family transcriptional regulator n=1 Tax=Rhodopila sp. TaxID=2480087 RepID=UPI002CC8F2A3|nr:LysR family transcriptional regulator [Rhodopila sp.]HVY14781.1 LysR family transcriptional regulator [Rhodopila sp.]